MYCSVTISPCVAILASSDKHRISVITKLQIGNLKIPKNNPEDFWQKLRVRLGTCKIDLSLPKFYITDRSNAILMCWFLLFYVLVFKIFVLLAPYVCFHIFS